MHRAILVIDGLYHMASSDSYAKQKKKIRKPFSGTVLLPKVWSGCGTPLTVTHWKVPSRIIECPNFSTIQLS